MEIRKRLLAVIAFMLCFSASFAQTDNVQKDINRVKRDTAYIYAEATMKKMEDAIEGAKAVLELQVAEWLKSQGMSGTETCVTKAKENIMTLQTRRGNFHRAFVYVKKSDIITFASESNVLVMKLSDGKSKKDKKESKTTKPVKPAAPAKEETPAETVAPPVKPAAPAKEETPAETVAPVKPAAPAKSSTPAVDDDMYMTPKKETASKPQKAQKKKVEKVEKAEGVEKKEEMTSVVQSANDRLISTTERQMKNVANVSDIKPLVLSWVDSEKVAPNNYGQTSTLPTSGNFHAFVYDRSGNVVAALRHTDGKTFNLNTLEADDMAKYKGKGYGVFWVRFK